MRQNQIFYFKWLLNLSGFNNLSSDIKDNTNKSLQTIDILGNILYVSLTLPLTIYIPIVLSILSAITSALHYSDTLLPIFWILSLPAGMIYLPKSWINLYTHPSLNQPHFLILPAYLFKEIHHMVMMWG